MTTPTQKADGGDIAFARASYSWDGSLDGYRAPTPIATDLSIYRIASAGGDPTFISKVPALDRERLVGTSTVGPTVRWSPDGTRLAFRILVDAPGIYVVNRDGSGMTRLTDLPEPGWDRLWGVTGGGLAWSPDGISIAFTSPAAAGGPTFGNSASLYMVDTRDGQLTELATENADGGARGTVAWSPDGSHVAFTRSKGALRGETHGIFVIAADGTGVERRLAEIDHADLFGFAWSPDGTRMAFSRSDGVKRIWGTGYELDGTGGAGLWVVNADGSGLRSINTEPWIGPTEVIGVHDGPIAWAPDQSVVAVVGGIERDAIRQVATDGSGERVLQTDRAISSLEFSPDGSQYLFSDWGGVATEKPPTWDPPSIYIINADGSGLRWLTDGEYPDWSDGGAPAP
jgi:Tol biopolymer transport system component